MCGCVPDWHAGWPRCGEVSPQSRRELPWLACGERRPWNPPPDPASSPHSLEPSLAAGTDNANIMPVKDVNKAGSPSARQRPPSQGTPWTGCHW